ncbi:hypothetical protein [Pseudogracilibacillus auburnensis]|uniref:hypothetical protein n=1 Tax=Pseudogracilibacillus auburnensis TaxID=1494959 RepID=UPI001A96CAFF|nr:hypothetical protein [Pseudogracilibacillus auburnensis]MBO1006005.1 hypothetical protein [Pseudogracilibacillus auburnensis]
MENKKQYTTQQIWIKIGHRLYPYFQEMTENAKNLYNITNYYIRQVYTALHNKKGLHPLQQEVLDILESNLRPINEMQRIACEKRRARELKKPIEKQKEIKLTLFQSPTKEKSFLTFRFLDALFKQIQQVDYRRLPIHSSQAVMRMVQQNWMSFFRSLKEYKVNPGKYKGRPGIPRYERNNQKEVYFSNQECSIQEGRYVKFPRTKTRLNIGKLGLSPGRFKQVRVLPRYQQFLVDLSWKSMDLILWNVSLIESWALIWG